MRQLLIQTSDMHADVIISTDPTDCIPSVCIPCTYATTRAASVLPAGLCYHC